MASPPQPILSVNVISFLWSPIKTWPQLLKTYSKKNPEETFFFPFKIIEKQILGESVWTTLAGESIKLSQAVWPSGVLGVVNRQSDSEGEMGADVIPFVPSLPPRRIQRQ